MLLGWIWEALGGKVRYDVKSIIIRFIIFDLWAWIFFAYGFFMLATGQLD